MSGIKGVIIFVIGAAVGGATAAPIAWNRAKKKIETKYSDKVKSLEEYADELDKKLDAEKKAHDLEYVSDENAEKIMIKRDELTRKKPEKRDYTVFYKKHEEVMDEMANRVHPEEDEYVDFELKEQSERMSSGKMKPRIIRADEYDDYEFHDKINLFYYTEDGVLATEDYEVVDDPEALLGDALTKYNFIHNDEDTIYVRNFSRGADYEITKYHRAFIDQIS